MGVKVLRPFVNGVESALEPGEERPGLHLLPLLNGTLQILDELLLLLDQLGRKSGETGSKTTIGPGAVKTVELLGRLLEFAP